MSVSPPALQCRPDFQREYLPPVTCAPQRYLGWAGVLCVSYFLETSMRCDSILHQIPKKLLMLPSRFSVPGRCLFGSFILSY